MLKFTIVTLFIYYFVSYSHSTVTTSEAIAAAETFRSTFGVPYQAAIEFLANSVLKPLADAPVPENSTVAQPLLANFTANIQLFSDQLKPLNESSQAFRQNLDLLTENLTVEHSRVETQVTNITTEIAEFSTRISSAQTQLDIAQRQVDAANEKLASAERILRDAEDRLNKGENCIIRKKRWGGWKSISRAVERAVQPVVQVVQPVVQPVVQEVKVIAKQAEVVVTKDIPNAVKDVINSPCQIFINLGNLKKDVNGARDGKNDAVTKRETVQRDYDGYVAARDQLSQQQGKLVGRKDELGVTLQQLNGEKIKVVEINTKIKQVIVHVSGLLDRGASLREIMTKMIDVEALVNPLNSVSDLVSGFSNDSAEVQKLSALKVVIAQSAGVVETKLPQYPLVFVPVKVK